MLSREAIPSTDRLCDEDLALVAVPCLVPAQSLSPFPWSGYGHDPAAYRDVGSGSPAAEFDSRKTRSI